MMSFISTQRLNLSDSKWETVEEMGGGRLNSDTFPHAEVMTQEEAGRRSLLNKAQ